jgi:hypothetical protein
MAQSLHVWRNTVPYTNRLLMTAILLAAIPCRASPPNAFEAGVWLEGQSFQLTRGSRATMQNGTAAFMPQAGAGYNAFWLRDYAYIRG